MLLHVSKYSLNDVIHQIDKRRHSSGCQFQTEHVHNACIPWLPFVCFFRFCVCVCPVSRIDSILVEDFDSLQVKRLVCASFSLRVCVCVCVCAGISKCLLPLTYCIMARIRRYAYVFLVRFSYPKSCAVAFQAVRQY